MQVRFLAFKVALNFFAGAFGIVWMTKKVDVTLNIKNSQKTL
jgi:hypothetical protein